MVRVEISVESLKRWIIELEQVYLFFDGRSTNSETLNNLDTLLNELELNERLLLHQVMREPRVDVEEELDASILNLVVS